MTVHPIMVKNPSKEITLAGFSCPLNLRNPSIGLKTSDTNTQEPNMPKLPVIGPKTYGAIYLKRVHRFEILPSSRKYCKVFPKNSQELFQACLIE